MKRILSTAIMMFKVLCIFSFFQSMGCSEQAGKRPHQELSEPVHLPFDSPLNLIVLEVRIRDQGPLRFMLDTGSPSSVIDTDVAKRIGLETGSANTRRGTAAGSQVTAASVKGGVDFQLAPGFVVHVDKVIAAPFTQSGKIMIGEHFDGILGSAIFHQFVVEVDYAKRMLTLHNAARYRYDGAGSVIDLDFPSHNPRQSFIRVSIVNGDRRLDDFPISVDSGGSLMGTASVARRIEWDALITPDNRIINVLSATGLSNSAEGTTHDAFVTRMNLLTLGPFEFENPLVSYSAGGPGFASMGASLLHRFTVVFDYSRKRMILEPNVNFDKPPMVDQSGALLVASASGDGKLEVWFVSEGTPAHEAGLARGDVIQAVDGVPTSDIQLNDARLMFCRAATYRLDVWREGRRFEVVMETQSLYGE